MIQISEKKNKINTKGKITETKEEAYCELHVSYTPNLNSPIINSSSSAARVLRSVWDMERINLQEQMYALLLDQGGRLLGWKMLNTGTRKQVEVDFTFLISLVVRTCATRIILAHNHPSGTLKESKADRVLTENLFYTMKPFMVNIDDHIIITQNGYYSFVDNDVFRRYGIKHKSEQIEDIYVKSTGGINDDSIDSLSTRIRDLNAHVEWIEREIAEKELKIGMSTERTKRFFGK